MTYILGARCKDGVVMVADKKIIYNHTAKYQKKLFGLSQSMIVAASGALSSFEKFKILITETLKEESKGLDTFALLKRLEEITQKVNNDYKYSINCITEFLIYL
jgi:20S proteasome alpha/beta subunit